MIYTKTLIIGGGKTTEELLKRLDLRKNQVVIVEKNPERRQEIMSNFDVIVIGKDASDPSLYTNDIKIDQYDCVIALTDNDEVNILSLAIAKMHNVKYRIARVSDPRIAELIERLELGTPVTQPSVVASIIKNYLFMPVNSVELTRFKIGEVEYYIHQVTALPNDEITGRKISDIEARGEGGLIKVLLIFDGEKFRPPSPEDEVKPGNQLIILSSFENIDSVIRR